MSPWGVLDPPPPSGGAGRDWICVPNRQIQNSRHPAATHRLTHHPRFPFKFSAQSALKNGSKISLIFCLIFNSILAPKIIQFGLQNASKIHSKSIQIFFAFFIDFWLHFRRHFQAFWANFSMVFRVLVEKARPYESIAPANQNKGPGPTRSLQNSLKIQVKNQ